MIRKFPDDSIQGIADSWWIRCLHGMKTRHTFSSAVYDVKELAEKTCSDLSILSIAASRVEKRVQMDKALAKKVV